MDDARPGTDPELAAIRAKIAREMMQQRPASPPAPTPAQGVPDIDDAGLTAFVQANENAVVDCWAPWCGPCRIVGPIVEELSREMAGRVAFAKLNVDTIPASSQAFGIQSIPTLLVFRAGRLVDRIVGVYPKPQLAALLERQLGRRGFGAPGPRRR